MRPKTLTEFCGQEKVKKQIEISIKAAQKQNRNLYHCLLAGTQGTGKTTLAHICANELNTSIQIANGANLHKIKNILPFIARITENSILFIDEAHRLSAEVQEILYPLMEGLPFDLVQGQQVIKLDTPPFCCIAATTQPGLLLKPFYDRFQLHLMMEDYTLKDLEQIAKKNLTEVSLRLDGSALASLIRRCKNNPRILINHILLLRDFALSINADSLTATGLDKVMELNGIDELGLNSQDRRYMNLLNNSWHPLGVASISASLGIDKHTIEDLIEPFLLSQGFVQRTPRGRISLKRDFNSMFN